MTKKIYRRPRHRGRPLLPALSTKIILDDRFCRASTGSRSCSANQVRKGKGKVEESRSALQIQKIQIGDVVRRVMNNVCDQDR